MPLGTFIYDAEFFPDILSCNPHQFGRVHLYIYVGL